MRSLYAIALVFAPATWAHPLEASQAVPQSLSQSLPQRTSTLSQRSAIDAVITSPAPRIELKRRDIGYYSSTCGYWPNGGDPITCGASSACYTWREGSAQGCCPTSTTASGCTIPTTCVPYKIYASCTSCSADTFAVTCSDSTSAYCAELWYSHDDPTTLTQHTCWTTPYSGWAWTSTESATSTSSSLPPPASSSAPPSPPSSAPPPTLSPAPPPSSTPLGTSTGIGDIPPTATATSPASAPIPTDFNTEAAAGGAVGGFAIAAILTFWFWSRLRRKRKVKSAAPKPLSLSNEKPTVLLSSPDTVSQPSSQPSNSLEDQISPNNMPLLVDAASSNPGVSDGTSASGTERMIKPLVTT